MKGQENPAGSVGIVGLGLIGGSLGLSLQALGWKVHGLVHRNITLEKAKERGLAHLISKDPTILSNCDVVIIALPLEKLLNPSEELINALPKSAVVTDVGSVKAPILKVWQKLHPRFIPSHPMAGTHESGVASGRSDLFVQRPWVATPDPKTDLEALKVINQLAISLGCFWITTDAYKHDQAVGLISHLPVLISAALLQTIGNERDPALRDLAKNIASSGFADTTRVGGGNPQLGTSMAENNTKVLLKALSSYRWNLEQLEATILAENWSKLQKELEFTKTLRERLLTERNYS